MSLIENDSKTLIINADDFAQSEAIDAAIIDLVERKAINATSALVLSPRWKKSVEKLIAQPIQVGLHLDLTSEFTHQFDCYYPLSKLIYAAYSRQLNMSQLEKVIELQWDRFVEGYGGVPDFIDGHQHVHQLPIVRDALFAVIVKKGWHLQASHWLRSCISKPWRGYKAKIVETLGAKPFQLKADALGIKTNSDFAGVYNFDDNANLNDLWESWLSQLHGKRPLIMCHVAVPSQLNQQIEQNEVAQDLIYSARLNEYKWLVSDNFKILRGAKGY